MKKTILLFLTACMMVSLTACSSKAERNTYDEAVELFEAGKYISALKLFEEVIDYKKADEYADTCRYYQAMQILSPDSSLENGYSGNVLDCTDSNYSQYAQAVALLEGLDGYKDSEKMLRDAGKLLEQYNEESRNRRLVATIADKFLGYSNRCEYDGTNFIIYFSDAYPITFEVLLRGQTESVVSESWQNVRGMFTEVIFEYLPDCIVQIVDCNGKTLGKYCKGSDITEVTVLYDAAEKPY